MINVEVPFYHLDYSEGLSPDRDLCLTVSSVNPSVTFIKITLDESVRAVQTRDTELMAALAQIYLDILAASC